MVRNPVARGLQAVLAVSSLLLSGCVSPRIIAGSAVSFNLAVEQAQNEMLLLNAVRASKRRPMYITGISKVTGSARVEVGANADVPLSDPVKSVSTRASYVLNPTYEVPVLDTQEFMKGFLVPVPRQILAYYWDQGWPRSLLLHLLVQRAKVQTEEAVTKDGKAQTEVTEYVFDNYPTSQDHLCKFAKFSQLVSLLLASEVNLHFENRVSSRAIGPSLPVEKFGTLADVLTANRDGLEMVEKDGRVQLYQYQSTLHLVVGDLQKVAAFAKAAGPCEGGDRPDPPPVQTLKTSGEKEAETTEEEIGQERKLQESVKVSVAGVSVELSFRSPEGVLYYLGQLLRFEESEGTMPEICIQKQYHPIFAAATACGRGLISVRYEGTRYAIPPEGGNGGDCGEDSSYRLSPLQECRAGRSMQSLSLLNQLIALHKSAKDMPGTSVVRTIGQ